MHWSYVFLALTHQYVFYLASPISIILMKFGHWLDQRLSISGLILDLHSANGRRRYEVTPSLIGWAQTQNQPWIWCFQSNQYWLFLQNNNIFISVISMFMTQKSPLWGPGEASGSIYRLPWQHHILHMTYCLHFGIIYLNIYRSWLDITGWLDIMKQETFHSDPITSTCDLSLSNKNFIALDKSL